MDLLDRQKNWLYTALKSANNVNSLDKKLKHAESVDAL
jgi:hypothetical protein